MNAGAPRDVAQLPVGSWHGQGQARRPGSPPHPGIALMSNLGRVAIRPGRDEPAHPGYPLEGKNGDMRGAWWLLAAWPSILLASCGATTTTSALSVQVVLSETSVVAGKSIHGDLVVTNDGAPINLTDVGRPFREPNSPYRCRPSFLVYLTNGVTQTEEGFAEPCVSRPFSIAHGVSRWPFQLLTTFGGCTQSGSGTADIPACGASGIPSLPPGGYETRVAWSESVPVPQPLPVSVELLG